MIHTYFHHFNKPVAFYCYTSAVVCSLVHVTDIRNDKSLSEVEQEIVDLIEDLRSKCDKLNLRNGYCSTRKDNKTVIAMSDGNTVLYFGKYDWSYWIGLDVSYVNDGRHKIDLSGISYKQWTGEEEW